MPEPEVPQVAELPKRKMLPEPRRTMRKRLVLPVRRRLPEEDEELLLERRLEVSLW